MSNVPEPAGAPADGPGRPGHVALRLGTTCKRLGFAPPPSPLRLRPERHRRGWRLVVWRGAAEPHDVLRWLDGLGALVMHVPRGGGSQPLVFEFDRAPRAWGAWLGRFTVQEVHLEPDGSASIDLAGPRSRVRAFAARARPGSIDSVQAVRPAPAPQDRPEGLLTERQHAALALAAAAGYYAVPRRSDLRSLARKMDISSPALSELLRRAESRVIGAYLRDAPRRTRKP